MSKFNFLNPLPAPIAPAPKIEKKRDSVKQNLIVGEIIIKTKPKKPRTVTF